MNAKELKDLSDFLKDLIDFLIAKDISEFELERGEVKVRLKRGGVAPALTAALAGVATPPVPLPTAASPASAPATGAGPAAPSVAPEEAGLHIVRSPIVGTFYEAASPGAPPFVKNGDHVHSGQVLCIIEAMKLMNEIESDISGVVVNRYVENAQPVEYGQPLFALRPAE